MPYRGSTKLTEQKFNTVTAQLAKNPYTPDMVAVIAAANGIRPSTVQTIHQLGNWKTFKARQAKNKVVAKIAVTETPSEVQALRDEVATLSRQLEGQRKLLGRLSDWVTNVEHNSLKRLWGRK
jgi:hypothetical protein